MRFTRTSKALGIMAVLAMSLTACGGGSGDGGNDGNAAGDTTKVITANNTEPQNGLLPANTNEVGGGKVMDLIFTGLVSYDVTGKSVNELAESIETKDSQNYTIKIKTGQTFSDGTPVTTRTLLMPGTLVLPPRTHS